VETCVDLFLAVDRTLRCEELPGNPGPRWVLGSPWARFRGRALKPAEGNRAAILLFGISEELTEFLCVPL
jgi:hypothetical protein